MKNRTAMIVFAHYPEDRRVRREAEAIAGAGMPVDVICLRGPGESFYELVEGVAAYRLPVVRKRGKRLRYLWEYLVFSVLAFVFVTALHIRRRYAIVHVHNMPDLLVFCAVIPKLTGSRLILDLHDPMPELFMTKYCLDRAHRVVRFLTRTEAWCIGFSNMVLTPNAAFRELFVARGAPPSKVRVIMNTPDLRYFRGNGHGSSNREQATPSGWRLMYHGALFERNGLDIALEAVGSLRHIMPGLTLDVYGDGDYTGKLLDRIEALRLSETVHYHGFVPPQLMSSRIELADIGIIPNRRTPFTEINLPTRIFEFLCMGKPVIAPRTRGITDYFDESSIFFFNPDDARDLASVIRRVCRDARWREAVLRRGIEVYEGYRWDLQKRDLIRLVGELGGRAVAPGTPRTRRRELLAHRGSR